MLCESSRGGLIGPERASCPLIRHRSLLDLTVHTDLRLLRIYNAPRNLNIMQYSESVKVIPDAWTVS